MSNQGFQLNSEITGPRTKFERDGSRLFRSLEAVETLLCKQIEMAVHSGESYDFPYRQPEWRNGMKLLKTGLITIALAFGAGGIQNATAYEHWHRPFFGGAGPLLVPVPLPPPRPVCGYGYVPVWKRDFAGRWLRVCMPSYR
jgi:hypothetical protein